jgi:ABC-type branched-subunit amino acid transport system permease subunit
MIIVLIDTRFGDILGTSTLARDTMLALVILIVNSALMFTGRIKMFSLIPGMFFGFAAFFATYFGGFGWDSTNPWVAWVCVIAMTALGPIYAWLAEWLVKPLHMKAAGAVVPSRIDA